MIDLAIVGAGPAGLTAAIYAARAGLDFVVLEQDGYGGGQIVSSHMVENYPGVGRVGGVNLGDAFRAQAEELGAEIRFAVVQGLRDLEDCKELLIEGEDPVRARAVIAATGAVPKKLGVPGERELTGIGVSYCATCDGAFYKGKDVLVVGGGDTAVEDAIYLSSLCRTVTVVLRREVFRAAKRRVEVLKGRDNVSILCNTNLTEIKGRDKVETVVLNSSGSIQERSMDGVFLAVGVAPASEWLEQLHIALKEGYVDAGEDCCTNIPGLFVAGDLRKKPLRQVITAAADGANAVISATAWLESVCLEHKA